MFQKEGLTRETQEQVDVPTSPRFLSLAMMALHNLANQASASQPIRVFGSWPKYTEISNTADPRERPSIRVIAHARHSPHDIYGTPVIPSLNHFNLAVLS